MKNPNLIFICIFFIIIFSFYNYAISSTVLNCDGDKVISKLKVKGRSAAQRIEKSLKDAMNKGKTCLPPDDYKMIKDKIDKFGIIFVLDCEMDDETCGENHDGAYIKLNAFMNFLTDSCGCLRSTLLHELLHWGAGVDGSIRGEQKAYSCELKCFPECDDGAGKRYGADPKHCCK